MIGFSESAGDPYSRQVCAFDIDDDLDEPVWSRQAADGEVLPLLRGSEDSAEENFEVQAGLVADVFPSPEHPGEEVVAIFAHKTSKRIIRIYNLKGHPIYEVWHDGAIVAPYWMSGAGLLVFAGDSHLGRWNEGGGPLVAEPIPLVVFAIRPQAGVIHDSAFLPTAAGKGAQAPVWYKCIYLEDGKPATNTDVSLTLRPPPNEEGSNQFVTLHLSLTLGTELSLALVLDEFGNVVDRSVSDAYEIALKKGDRLLPDPGKIKLGSMPPLPEAAEAAKQGSAQGEEERE